MPCAQLWARWSAGTLLAGAALLSGCVTVGNAKPPQRLLHLTSEVLAPAGGAVVASPGNVLVVAEPLTDRALSIPRVAVQVSPSEIAYLDGAAWVERPARQFRALLAETLRAQGGALVIEDDADTPRGATRLEGRLLAMGYDARQKAAVVRYDAIRRGADGTVTMRRFESVETGIMPKVAAVAPVLNRLANKVAADVAVWMAAPVK
ncbi:ABC transporter [Novosphingobium sp. FSY-8]|uniref:ABC transporter n=2 Tax=Novosphingobium ovatum TaxID=1908523 RepID=A0ABW9XE14_9SPHN|nr:ABC transporter [Novosphingobium ovatum]